MEKIKETLLIVAIVLFAIISYFAMPKLIMFAARNIHGLQGLFFLCLAVLIITARYYLMGYRGKSLAYVIAILLFLAVCIWLYFNYRSIDTIISERYGQAVATAIFLAVIAAVWLFTRFML